MSDLTEWIILGIMLAFGIGVAVFYGEQARQLKNELRRRREDREEREGKAG
ncbi:hypothetical protein GCM10007420_12910 [Glycocaulis albus]|uniref:Uncharacterized protein n=1 Tax=Glycocaulis albus TaxID=1382801 RepID=A0ABQ1XNQ8_9PROT|nr:hypothetical protein [Glycocaulis albus]GGG98545.1 hypothetical protein GCM10007420_12910 [Glycocaulis albus]